jgi:hypothetical protein
MLYIRIKIASNLFETLLESIYILTIYGQHINAYQNRIFACRQRKDGLEDNVSVPDESGQRSTAETG